MKHVLLTLAALAVIGAIAAASIVYGGLYDVSATDQHLAPTFRAIDTAMRNSIKRRAADIVVPPLEGDEMLQRGAALFRDHCVQCHGAPGVAPEPFALGLTPAPANLAHTARVWPPADIYWAVRNGIKMTGMPAWEFRLPDADLWAVVAFVEKLPELSPEDYRTRVSGLAPHDHAEHDRHGEKTETPAGDPILTATDADRDRGRRALRQYACPTCHAIPGIVGPDAPVGPPLDGIATRAFIAGVLENEPGALVRWLRQPHEIAPRSAMPNLGVTEKDARDMAAYLATLR